MSIAPFPHHYTVTIADGSLRASPRPAVPVGAPPQFGGTDRVWSPEELLIGAALLCLQTTFEAFARRQALAIGAWHGTGTGVLDKTAAGPAFTSVKLDIELVVAAGDEQNARRLLHTAERHCIISRALTVPVTVTASVTAGATGSPIQAAS